MDKIINRASFMHSLNNRQREDGYIKFNIPPEHPSAYPEGVWGWVSGEDKKKYQNNSFCGKITAILCNNPLNYCGLLEYGSEVVIKCNGEYRAELDPAWMRKYLSA